MIKLCLLPWLTMGVLLAGCEGGPFFPLRPKPSSWRRVPLGVDVSYAFDVWGTGSDDMWILYNKKLLHKFNGEGVKTQFQIQDFSYDDLWGSKRGEINVIYYGYNQMVEKGGALRCTVSCEQIDILPANSKPWYFRGGWSGSSGRAWLVGQESPTGVTGMHGIYYWDGKTWTLEYQAADESISLSGVWGIEEQGSLSIWAFGSVFLYRNKGVWTSMPISAGTYIQALWGISPTEIWAVGGASSGARPAILHWNGLSWTPFSYDGDPSEMFTTIWGSSANDIWVGGTIRDFEKFRNNRGTLTHWDGTSWTRDATAPLNQGVRRLWGTSSQDIWAAIGEDALLHYSPIAAEASPLDGGVDAR